MTSLPACLFDMPSLTALRARRNRIAALPVTFDGTSSQLRILDLSLNELTATTVNRLSRLPGLIQLDLSSNQLDNCDWREPFRALEEINLAFNQITELCSGCMSVRLSPLVVEHEQTLRNR